MKSSLIDVDLRPYFHEAVDKFGLVKAEYIDWIIAQAFTEDGKGIGADTIRYKNKSTWQDCLTPLGGSDPVTSFDDTFWYAIGKARRDSNKASDTAIMARPSTFAGILTSAPTPPGYCRVGEAMANRVLSTHPDLPYSGCEQRCCRCSWILLFGPSAPEKIKSSGYLDCRDPDHVRRYEEERIKIEKNTERLKKLGIEIDIKVTLKQN
jgi:hypothetical protein